MRIAVYTVCYNEQFFLPFFLRHYLSFANKIVVYDNVSTDNSVAIALAAGCECRSYDTQNSIRDDLMLEVKNNCWKECRGQNYDWVIVVDVDEIVYHPNLIQRLSELRNQNYTLIVPTGCQMISLELPKDNTQLIYETHTNGLFLKKYNKPCIFNPDAFEEIGYFPGGHFAYPTGNIRPFLGEFKLLHYSMLSQRYMLARRLLYSRRLSDINKQHGWGKNYLNKTNEQVAEFDRYLSQAQCVI